MKLQRTLIIFAVLTICSNAIAQKTVEKYPLNDFFEDYFKARELNTILKYNDPDSDAIIYTVDGVKQLKELNPKLLFLHESYASHDKITIQTRFTVKELWSIKEKYDLINSWANPSFPASIFWDAKRNVFVLTVSTIVFSKSVSLSRIDDLFLGFIAALKNLNDTQKIEL